MEDKTAQSKARPIVICAVAFVLIANVAVMGGLVYYLRGYELAKERADTALERQASHEQAVDELIRKKSAFIAEINILDARKSELEPRIADLKARLASWNFT